MKNGIIRKILPVFLTMLSSLAGAQILQTATDTGIADLVLRPDTGKSRLAISFNVPGVEYNLLVRVTSPEGETLFLDNQYNFSGDYRQSVMLEPGKKGVFYIDIRRDRKKQISRKLEVK